MSLSTALFDYDLPERLVAQSPAEKRDNSRLLVVHRQSGRLEHLRFSDLPSFVAAGDVLFRNNAAVLPARLYARKPSGGEVECFLLKKIEAPDKQLWRCLLRPGKRLQPGARFSNPSGDFEAEVVEKFEDGSAAVCFLTQNNESVESVAGRVGTVPLPPYINREDDSKREKDLDRYQTVYANKGRQVAVAAPTAGLHFTPQLLEEVSAKGAEFAELTLHVGLGTFKPISTETVEEHLIHRELYEVPSASQNLLLNPIKGRRFAVGTTSVRTIEDFLGKCRQASAMDFVGEASLFIYPPRRFQGVDALITNFHQPRSTLLCLVSAFLAPGSTEGIDWLREIYREAIGMEYRFFSYGDAMLIL